MIARFALLTLIAHLLTGSATALAQDQTRYVSDELRINMRTGPSLQNRITRMLPAGEEVRILANDKAAGYSRVRTAEGADGWVLTRQLSDAPSAKDRLGEAQRTLEALRVENESISEQLSSLRSAHTQVSSERQKLESESQRLSRELDSVKRTAARTLKIVKENEALRVDVQDLEVQMQTLRKERDELRDGSARDWFLVGAGVILLGIIVGLILPRLRLRRRASSWNSL